MAEPVVIDRLPVELNPTQQTVWDSGDAGKRLIRKELRAERLAAQKPVEEMTPAPSFNEVMGE